MLPALAGANLIYGLGMLEMGITFDFAQLVMDDEIVRMIQKCVEGISINEEEMAVAIIQQVGACGEFISHEHTFHHFKKQSQAKLIDRRMRDAWMAEGGKDLTERAYEEARYILKNHKPDPLPGGVTETLREIVLDAEAEYGVIR